MIQLSPDLTSPTYCPACEAENETAAQVYFGGAVTGVQATCPACGATYLNTLPNGQFNRFPVAISTNGHHVRVAERGRWLVDLVKSCQVISDDPDGSYAISPGYGVTNTTIQTNASDVILLLCLDPCYGHALMMLFNAQRHHVQHPARPIIAVVPRALAWLVPDYVAETWVVDLPLSGLKNNVPGFDAFVKQQLTRFKTVWFSRALIHFDHRTTRFSDFTRTQKFDLNQFGEEMPRITLILREDRLWLRHPWERWLHKAMIRLNLEPRTRPLWARWQANRYRKLKAALHEKGLLTSTVAVGLTGGGQYPIDLGYAIQDERQPAPLSPEQERAWCALYARSHVVVGVHGSGMLLPTSLAAGFVNLLPPDKLPHYAEDVLLAHDNPIHQTLLGRFEPTSASPRQVAASIASILTEFPVWLAEARERTS